MNTLIVAVACMLAVASASPSGIGGIVAGPVGLGAALIPPSASAVISGPALGLGGLGVGLGGVGIGNAGLGLGGIGLGGAGLGINGLGLAGVGVPAAVGVGLGGVGAITNGGGAISATAHGAAIAGPGTAPVVVAGPSGRIAADGLWGPTANIGGLGALGAVRHGW